MNWDQLEGGWKQRRGKAARTWGTLMRDDLTAMAGRYEELVGKLQARYGDARDKAIRQQNDFAKIVLQLRQANARLKQLLSQIRVKRSNVIRRDAVVQLVAEKRRKPSPRSSRKGSRPKAKSSGARTVRRRA